MTSSIPGAGLRGSSEGNVADEGVFSAGRAGLGDRGVLMMGTEGIVVGEEDTVGDVDDEVEPSVTEDGCDEASDGVGDNMMNRSTFNAPKAGYDMNESMPAADNE